MSKRILVLEDDPDFLECVTTILQTEGFSVIPLQQLTVPEDLLSADPDCILLDEVLPSINGHTICMILKRVFGNNKGIPILLMSGLDDLQERAELCGADGFMQKPFRSNSEFVSLIQKVAC